MFSRSVIAFVLLGLSTIFGKGESTIPTEVALTPGLEYTLRNPGYPNNYEAGLHLAWNFTSHSDYRVHVNCSVISIPESENCDKDVLTLNGKQFCSSKKILFFAQASSLSVTFKSTTNLGKFCCRVISVFKPCQCGRIKKTAVDKYPFAATITKDGVPICGAVLISQYYALTTVYCFNKRNPLNLKVVVGRHQAKITTSYTIAAVKKNAFDQGRKYLNDIALVRPSTPFVLSEHVSIACLPYQLVDVDPKDFAGREVINYGLGPKLPSPVELKLKSSKKATCTLKYPGSSSLSNLCTEVYPKTSCMFHTGTGVYYEDYSNGRFYVAGLVSGTDIELCEKSNVGLNTRVVEYMDWVNKPASLGIPYPTSVSCNYTMSPIPRAPVLVYRDSMDNRENRDNRIIFRDNREYRDDRDKRENREDSDNRQSYRDDRNTAIWYINNDNGESRDRSHLSLRDN